MARLNVAPTKSVQLNLRRDLEMATEGYNLLEQKREILVMEMMRLLDRVQHVQRELHERQETAYRTLRRAIAQNGLLHLRNVASGIHYEHQVKVESSLLAGFRIPKIQTEHTMKQFLELMESVAALAELETTVMLLARELKKTQRRVNALEHLFIPDYKATLHYIGESLESKELDSFFTSKLIKKRLEAAQRKTEEETHG